MILSNSIYPSADKQHKHCSYGCPGISEAVATTPRCPGLLPYFTPVLSIFSVESTIAILNPINRFDAGFSIWSANDEDGDSQGNHHQNCRDSESLLVAMHGSKVKTYPG